MQRQGRNTLNEERQPISHDGRYTLTLPWEARARNVGLQLVEV